MNWVIMGLSNTLFSPKSSSELMLTGCQIDPKNRFLPNLYQNTQFYCSKMHLKRLFAKCQPFCSSLIVLKGKWWHPTPPQRSNGDNPQTSPLVCTSKKAVIKDWSNFIGCPIMGGLSVCILWVFQTCFWDVNSLAPGKFEWKFRWVRSRNCGSLVTWFCYQLIAKPGNKTAAVSWPDPDM